MFISNSLCIKENFNKQVKLNLQNFIFVVFTLKKKIVMRVDIKNKKKTKEWQRILLQMPNLCQQHWVSLFYSGKNISAEIIELSWNSNYKFDDDKQSPSLFKNTSVLTAAIADCRC